MICPQNDCFSKTIYIQKGKFFNIFYLALHNFCFYIVLLRVTVILNIPCEFLNLCNEKVKKKNNGILFSKCVCISEN